MQNQIHKNLDYIIKVAFSYVSPLTNLPIRGVGWGGGWISKVVSKLFRAVTYTYCWCDYSCYPCCSDHRGRCYAMLCYVIATSKRAKVAAVKVGTALAKYKYKHRHETRK